MGYRTAWQHRDRYHPRLIPQKPRECTYWSGKGGLAWCGEKPELSDCVTVKVMSAFAEKPLGSESVSCSGRPIASGCVSREVAVSTAAFMSVTSTRPVMMTSAVRLPRVSPEEADTASLHHDCQPVIHLVHSDIHGCHPNQARHDDVCHQTKASVPRRS